MLPAVSTATADGVLSRALIAGPPSPAKPEPPLPTTVEMVPSVETLRMRLLLKSAMKTFPVVSTATPLGVYNCAEPAALPSPPKPGVPLPAIVEPDPEGEYLRTRAPNASATYTLP